MNLKSKQFQGIHILWIVAYFGESPCFRVQDNLGQTGEQHAVYSSAAFSFQGLTWQAWFQAWEKQFLHVFIKAFFSISDQTTNVCCGPSYFLIGNVEIGFFTDVLGQHTLPSLFFLFCCTPSLHAEVPTGLGGRGRTGQNLQGIIMQSAGTRSVQTLNPAFLTELWTQLWV